MCVPRWRFPNPLIGAFVAILVVGCGARTLGDHEATRDAAGSKQSLPQVVFPSVSVTVELARTAAERAKGLGGHAPLGERDGMLFIFEQPGQHAFWMKGMTFGLDIIWLDAERVVHVEAHVPPPAPDAADATLPVYAPHSPAQYVLEVNAGFAGRHGIGVGTRAQFRGI
jgi:uncharacterized membrane protein (UPF0127 family)